MRATPLVRTRIVTARDAFVDVVIRRLPRPSPRSPASFKFRLAYIVAGECVVRYDNERGKGDHKHFGNAEEKYVFSSPEQLIADFLVDIERWNREHRRS